jgi:hypothetical protein
MGAIQIEGRLRGSSKFATHQTRCVALILNRTLLLNSPEGEKIVTSKPFILGRELPRPKSGWTKTAILCFLGLLVSSACTPTQAQVVYNPSNGHYYELVFTGLEWWDAKTEAHTRTYLGLRGHLATITSADESLFVATNIPDAINFTSYLGGYQDWNAPDYSEPAGGWRWVTGEPWNYTDWSPGEPNNSNNHEDYLHFLTNGQWNDFSGYGPDQYLVEYESYPPLFHYDFDGDGKADLVLQNQTTNQVAVWNMNGLMVAGGALVAAVPDPAYQVVAIADFNGDGHPDLVLQNATTGQIVLWYMNGTTLIGGAVLSATPDPAYKVVGAGDFNGDSKMDLVLQNQTTGQIVFWFLNGTTVIGGTPLPLVPVSGYKVVGVGDFHGYGQLDLLFQNQTSGTLTAWFLNGTTFVGSMGITAAPGANWKVKGVADFNSDGSPDIVFQNQTTGQAMLWYMSGVNFQSGGPLSFTPAANYQIVGPH